MLAAHQQDPETLRQHYLGVDEIILSIDGLQPEKGHETLYVVRELTGKRVWFAEALLSATADEVQRLIAQARRWAEGLGKTVTLWISDKQDAFVTGIAGEFPGVPHRYCSNHFLRDLAKPVLAQADSHAKVQMRPEGPRPEDRAGGPEASARIRRRASSGTAVPGDGNRDRGRRRARSARGPGGPGRRRGPGLLRRGPGHPSTTTRAARSIRPDCGWPKSVG